MVHNFRLIFGYAAMLPFSLCFRIVSLFMGKQRSAALVGKALTKISVLFLGSAIPNLSDKGQFEGFKRTIIRNFTVSFKPLYDVEVISESNGAVEFKILNCPFTSALKNLGAQELCKFACAADFMIAHRNKSKWKFSRTHSLGTDGICCNHTYYSLDTKDRQTQ